MSSEDLSKRSVQAESDKRVRILIKCFSNACLAPSTSIVTRADFDERVDDELFL